MTTRTRIAPSPTGPFHVGTARTALFSWLYARQKGGEFVLRIEDTDTDRSNKKYEEDIRAGLEWLGISWDEEYRQSERFAIYKKYAQQLLKEGRAYEEVGKKGEKKAIILRAPERAISFSDEIRGEITVEAEQIDDIVCIKSDGTPTYNFAVTVDDHEMGITHVIRGEDHISNTPRQITVQETLGFTRPTYAHLPLILGDDKSKLSKRHGATSVNEYQKQGYLPEALINFLALLGWNPGTDKEIFSQKELIETFSLTQVQKGGAVFNRDKLNWINQQHIQNLSHENLKKRIQQYVKAFAPAVSPKQISDTLTRIAQPRIETLAEAVEDLQWLESLAYKAELLPWKETSAEKTATYLSAIHDILEKLPEKAFTIDQIEEKLMPYADEQGRGEVLWPLRVALSGKKASPGPFELLALVGKEKALARIETAVEKLT